MPSRSKIISQTRANTSGKVFVGIPGGASKGFPPRPAKARIWKASMAPSAVTPSNQI
jgi:hypothetical protein